MLNIRHALIFFSIAVTLFILLLASESDSKASRYLNGAYSAHSAISSETADLRKICDRHHSILYSDVESTEAYWDSVGGITRDDLELSRYMCEKNGNCVTIKLYNGTIYIRTPIEKQLSFQSRAHSMLLMLSRTDLSDAPNIDFLLDTNDGTRLYEPCFLEMDKHISEATSKSREKGVNHFLFPDFTTFDWYETRLPPFNEARLTLSSPADPFSSKIPKLFWRGAPGLQQGTQRLDLITRLGNQTDVADVAGIAHKDFKSPHDPNNNFKTLDEMCKYQYIVYTEGMAYSGRLKYTSLCNSVQIGLKITFIEFWTHILKPYYVEAKDWDDGLQQYLRLRDQPARAEALAAGARDIIRKHLSPTGVSCYVRRVLEGYARSIRWLVIGPEQDILGRNGDGEDVDYWTWVPLDHFLAKMFWLGTEMDSQHATKKILWGD
ncbi:MAG: hypothetical protein Q9227_004365 [Pyrenula ochraceoflavens]